MLTDNTIVAVENLNKTYKGGKTAVSDLSFTLVPGNILALLGPNGAGKTTTIKMLLGLVTPNSGSIRVCGHNMLVEKEMRAGLSHIGAVLEGARNSYWRLTAMDNLLYFGGLRKLPQAKLKMRARELLDFLGLGEDADKEVRKFSRGMQQKLALAIAILHDPEILLLDEPTLGLDVQAAKLLEQRIVELAQQGKVIILTTHTMPLAEKLATNILVMSKGKKVAYDRKQDLLRKFNTRTTTEIHLENELAKPVQRLLYEQFIAIKVVPSENGGSHITWLEPEQSQVIQLLNFLDQHGQAIASVVKRESSLEEIFLSLVNESNHDTGVKTYSS